jgi:hypothetical protein
MPDEPKPPLAHHVLLRLDSGVLAAMGRGERGEAAPEAWRAGHRAQGPDRGDAGSDAPTTEVAIGPTFFPSRSKLPLPFFSNEGFLRTTGAPVLSKPFHLDELREVVRRALVRRPAETLRTENRLLGRDQAVSESAPDVLEQVPLPRVL